MDQILFRTLLEQVRSGEVAVDQALERMRHLPFEDLGFAKVDHHRALRHGMPEVILAKGKTPDQVVAIARALLEHAPNVLITRANSECAAAVSAQIPDADYSAVAGTIRFWRDRSIRGKGKIAVVCAGTSDLPVAEEARITAEVMGNQVECTNDIGVAGIHRLMHHRERLASARVVVVGGLVSCPVIAVPTSVGYGASFHGLAALLGMLNSCSSNVAVVNIDNGFGAGYVASLINRE
jgi:NCAIR mutase (PurE)-related protein